MIHTLEKMAEHKIMSERYDQTPLIGRLAQTADRTGS